MNKAYKCVYNAVTGAWVAVSELATSKGKTKNSKAALVAAAVLGMTASTGTLAQNVDYEAREQARAARYEASLAQEAADAAQKDATKALKDSAAAQTDATKANDAITAAGLTETGTNFFRVSEDNNGEKAAASGRNAVAMGAGAVANGINTVAIGENTANGDNAIAIGSKNTTNIGSIVLGTASTAAIQAIAMGTSAIADSTGNLAIGEKANARGANSIAMGQNSLTDSSDSYASGANAKAHGVGSTAVGSGAIAQGGAADQHSKGQTSYATALGQGAHAKYQGTTSIGAKSNAQGTFSTSLGFSSGSTVSEHQGPMLDENGNPKLDTNGNPILMSDDKEMTSYIANVAVGAFAGNDVKGGSNTTVGYLSGQKVTGQYNTALGSSAGRNIEGNANISIGHEANDFNKAGLIRIKDAIAIGNQAKSTADGSVSIGGFSEVSGSAREGIAIGRSSKVTGNESIALGYGSKAQANNSIAIGSGSIATETDTVSFGSETAKRRLTHVKNGVAATDAVNKSQLDDVYGFFGVTSDYSANGEKPEYEVTFTNKDTGATETKKVDSLAEAIALSGGVADAAIYGHGRTLVVGTAIADNQAVNKKQLDEKTRFLGVNNTNTGMGNYDGGGAKGNNAIALGVNAHAEAENGIAIGEGVRAGLQSGHQNAIAIGHNLEALDKNTVVLGNNSIAEKEGSTVIGTNAKSNAKHTIVMGTNANVQQGSGSSNAHEAADYAIALGMNSDVTRENGVAIGHDAKVYGKNALSFGYKATNEGFADNGIAMGVSAFNDSSSGTAIGHGATNGDLKTGRDTATRGSAIGYNAHNNAVSGLAVGDTAVNTGKSGLAVGNTAKNSGENGSAIGVNAVNEGLDSIAFGTNSKTTADEAIALGKNSKAFGSQSIATGFNSEAKADGSVANGRNSWAAGVDAIATGSGAKAHAKNSIATGTGANAHGENSIATGTNAEATGSAVALGNNTKAEGKSVALGDGSVASSSSNTTAIFSSEKNKDFDVGVISVGSTGKERRITNVAGGIENNDAVNVLQLRTIANGVAEVIGNTTVDPATGKFINPSIGNTGKNNIHDAIDTVRKSTFALQGNEGDAVTKPLNDTIKVVGSSDNKNIKTINKNGEIQIVLNNDLNLNSVTTGDVLLDKDGLSFKGNNTPSIRAAGIDAGSQNITNVKAGVLDTDAVNFGQLKSSNISIHQTIGGTVATTNPDGTVIYGDIGGTQQTTVDAAIRSVKQQVADSTFGLTANTGEDVRKLGDKISIKGDSNITTSATQGDGLVVALNPHVDLTSANIGGVNIKNNGITNLAAGQINDQSTDAVNGSQLANLVGTGVTVVDGKYVAPDLGGTGQGNVNDAIKHVNDKVGAAEFGLAGDTGSVKRKLNEEIKVAGDSNITTTADKDGLKIALNEHVKLTSANIGGVVVANGGIANLSSGLKGNKAADLTDEQLKEVGLNAVNVTDLSKTAQDITNNFNTEIGKQTFGLTADSGEDVRKLGDKISIKGDSNITTSATQDGGLVVALNDDIDVKTVTTGKSKLDTNGLTVLGDNGRKTFVNDEGLSFTNRNGKKTGPSITRAGIDAGEKVITGVADGKISADSLQAINGSQLFNTIGSGAIDENGKIVNLGNVIGATNVHDAITAVNTIATTAAQGWKVSTDSGNGGDVSTVNADNNTVDFASKDGNIKVSNEGNNVKLELNKDLDLASVNLTAENGDKATLDASKGLDLLGADGESVAQYGRDGFKLKFAEGDVTLNNAGLSFGNGPSIGFGGINAGNMQITNVASGLKGQSLSSITGDDLKNAVNVGDLKNAIGNVETQIENLDKNAVKYDVNDDGSINTGKVTLEGTDGTVIANLGDGEVAKGSNEAINGGQLNDALVGDKDWNDIIASITTNADGNKTGGLGNTGESNVHDALLNLKNEFKTEIDANATKYVVHNDGKKVDVDMNELNVLNYGNNMTVSMSGDGTTDKPLTMTVDVSKDLKDMESVQFVNKAGESTININGDTGQISGLKDATQADQAVNLGQMNRELGKLDARVDKVEKNANAGTALAMATAGLPQAYLPGKSMMSMSGSVYRGEAGYAVGVSSISDNGHWVVKGAASGNARGYFGATVGAGYQW